MNGRRKPRRPRWAPTPDTIVLATHRASKLSAVEVAEIMTPLRASFRALREGVATDDDWAVLAGAVTAAKAIERQGIVRGAREHLDSAEAALDAVNDRAMANGTAAAPWRQTALHWHEIDDISAALDIYKLQIQELSRGEAMRALEPAIARVQQTGGDLVQLSAPQAPRASA